MATAIETDEMWRKVMRLLHFFLIYQKLDEELRCNINEHLTCRTVQYAVTGVMDYKVIPNKLPFVELYRGKKPALVLFDLEEDKIPTFASEIQKFVKKWKVKTLMIAGPCQSTRAIDQLVCDVIVEAFKDST